MYSGPPLFTNILHCHNFSLRIQPLHTGHLWLSPLRETGGSIRGAWCEVADYPQATITFFSLQELGTTVASLRDVSHYYFDGQGKNIRPMIVQLMAGACNHHTCETRYVHSNKISFRFGPITMTCFVSLSSECSESWFLRSSLSIYNALHKHQQSFSYNIWQILVFSCFVHFLMTQLA